MMMLSYPENIHMECRPAIEDLTQVSSATPFCRARKGVSDEIPVLTQRYQTSPASLTVEITKLPSNPAPDSSGTEQLWHRAWLLVSGQL